METILGFIEAIGGILWGPWTPLVLLAAGLLFTVWTRFTQAASMTHGVQVVRGVYDDPDDPGAISHFQALSAALSATVGLGNIGGVALAIGIGGPGAVFWMWLVAVFGMALKSVEITLAMMYRNTDDPDNPHGGAMWVVDEVIGKKGGGMKVLAKLIGGFFCVTLIISTFTGGNMFQAWSVAGLTETYFDVPKIATGIIMAVIVGLVIIGGIKRIGNVAGKVVPFMCLLYLLAGLAVVALHITDIPSMFALIFTSAFSPTEAAGAFIGGGVGFAFMEGMKRSLFSNEAGQGSAPIAHAAAKTNEPAREGIVGGLGPFIDTICICTLTAMVILSTGTWNRDAIGVVAAPVNLVAAEGDADHLVWNVEGPSDVGSLPKGEYETWSVGDTFYLIANVAGAVEAGKERTVVKITGSIREVAGDSDEAAKGMEVVWDPLKVAKADWIGTIGSIKLMNLGVHRQYGGAELTGHAFDRAFKGLGKWLVTLAAWLFAISTMISWSYYGEQGVVYLAGKRGILPYKIVFLILVVVAAVGIKDAQEMIIIMDLGTGAMLWSNIPIVLGLGYLAVREMNQYMRKLKAGEFKRYDKEK